MSASLEQSIREAIRQYIAGRIPLREFQEWFASRTWDVGAESDDNLRRLVNEIDLLVAEFSNGDWTEEELKSNLQDYRRIVQPVQAVRGVLWSEVQAPYVYVATSGTHNSYEKTTYPGAAPPTLSPRIELSPLRA